jgi:serine/threonine-protein kinase
MARVFEAHDTRLDRRVAVKVARSEKQAAISRFQLEARVTGRLDHPNILPLYDLGVDESGTPFITMKIVPNHQTLEDVIDALAEGDPDMHRRFPFQRRVALIQEVARAIAAAQRVGILHRDIKPANVVLGDGGEVYLADWGVACGPSLSVPEDEEYVVGTPIYMAPELLRNAPSDAGTEVYSLTATLYEFLTLRHHLGAPRSVKEVLSAHRREVAWADRFKNPISGRVPRALAVVCQKGLRRDPSQRYASVQELVADLQAWLNGRGKVVCAGTFLQRALMAWSRKIDQHTYLGPLISYTFLATLLGCAVHVLKQVL